MALYKFCIVLYCIVLLTIAKNDRSDLYLVSPTAARQELEEGETARLVNLATVVSLKC